MAKRLSQEFAEFLQLCSAEGVRFVVIGGQAIIFYGRVRATLDLDVLVAPTRANAAKVARVIARFAAPFAGPYDFAKPDTGVRIGPDAGLHIDVTNSIDGIQTKTYFPIPRRPTAPPSFPGETAEAVLHRAQRAAPAAPRRAEPAEP